MTRTDTGPLPHDYAESTAAPTAARAPSRDRERLARALAGGVFETRALVAEWTPIVQSRVARALARRGGAAVRGAAVIREDVRDLTQDVLSLLFAEDGRVLRAWAPERGLSLGSFVGLVAERHAVSVARTRRRSPLTERPTDIDDLALVCADRAPLARLERRELARVLTERLLEELTPMGRQMFEALFVEEHEVEAVCAELSTTADAVYAWRVRIRRAAERIAQELDA